MISLWVHSTRLESCEGRNGYSQSLAEWLACNRELKWTQSFGSRKRLQRTEEAQETTVCSEFKQNTRTQHGSFWQEHHHPQLWCLTDWGWYPGLYFGRHGLLGKYHPINKNLILVMYKTWIVIPTSLNEVMYVRSVAKRLAYDRCPSPSLRDFPSIFKKNFPWVDAGRD